MCCLSEEGKLHFYMIGPQAWHADELDFARSSITSAAASSAGSGAKSSASAEDVPDSGVPADGLPKYGEKSLLSLSCNILMGRLSVSPGLSCLLVASG